MKKFITKHTGLVDFILKNLILLFSISCGIIYSNFFQLELTFGFVLLLFGWIASIIIPTIILSKIAHGWVNKNLEEHVKIQKQEIINQQIQKTLKCGCEFPNNLEIVAFSNNQSGLDSIIRFLNNSIEFATWMKDNIKGDFKTFDHSLDDKKKFYIEFEDEQDALAFKLRWL